MATGELENWRTGELENWGAGELENWGAGELGSWGDGELATADQSVRRLSLDAAVVREAEKIARSSMAS
jgi:hypothetical protein